MTGAGHDFPDRVNPFLVKELRQGLASGGYRAFFLLMAAVVAGNAVFCHLGDLKFQSRILAGIVGFILCPVFPLSVLGAVLNERRGRKLELLVMTNLTSWRIVAGMWLVRAAQAALLVVLALPGVLLGYFDGGVDIVGLLAGLAVAYAACVTATAVVLFASGLLREGNTALNAVIRVVLFFVFFQGSTMTLVFTAFVGVSGANPVAILAVVLFAAAVLTALFLFFAGLTLGVGFRTPASSRKKLPVA